MNALIRRADDLIERHIGARTPLSQETIDVLRELRDAAKIDPAAPHYTLTQRERVALELRVPESGTDWIDEMICDSLRNEYAGIVLNGLWSTMTEDMAKGFNDAGVGLPEVAYTQANLMVARARNGGEL